VASRRTRNLNGSMDDARPEIRFGAKLRVARKARGLTIQQVADASGVTKGFVAQVERDETSPSVSTLLRICDAIGIAVGALFDAPRGDLVRAAERTRIDFGGIDVVDWLLSPGPDAPLQVILSEIAPGGGGGDEPYTLACDHEFVLVLSGALRLTIGERAHDLAAGDAMTFSPRAPHAWGNASADEPATVLWVLSPSPYARGGTSGSRAVGESGGMPRGHPERSRGISSGREYDERDASTSSA
jgi:transcriptional regulator with XRE-family HTH domain